MRRRGAIIVGNPARATSRQPLHTPQLVDRDKQILFDTTGTTVRAPGSQRPLPEVLDQLCANIEVGLEHLEEAVWFEHLKVDGTKIHQHPLAAEEPLPDLAEIREELYASLRSFTCRSHHGRG